MELKYLTHKPIITLFNFKIRKRPIFHVARPKLHVGPDEPLGSIYDTK
jgi:hypothetical protein